MNELEELIDVKTWKQIQDKFALSIGLPVYTIDRDGNEVISSRFPTFCQIMRSKCGKKCMESRKKYFEKLKKDTILVFKCHAGLYNIIVPLSVKDNIVGAVICGAILRTEQNVPICRRLFADTGIPTLQLLDEMRKLRLQDRKDLEKYATLLYLLSRTVPEIVHEKHETEKKMNEFKILNKMIGLINSTLEIETTITSIIKFLNKELEIKECSILLTKKNIRYGKLREKEVIAIEKDMQKEVFEKRERKVISIKKDARFKELKLPYELLVALPLEIKGEQIGTINLYYEEPTIKEERLNFISIIAHQAAMAIVNAQQYEQIRIMAITDKLTGLYNRRHFIKILENEIERAERTKKPISVALIDVDNFSNYNNTYGHPAGDRMLKEMADIFKKNVRVVDTVGRYGGEEFIIILPESEMEQSKEIMERLKDMVAENSFEGRNITISAGLTNYKNSIANKEQIIQQTDELLYRAKGEGKNKVVYQEF